MPKGSKKKKKTKVDTADDDADDDGDDAVGIVPSDGGVRLGNKGGVGIALCIGSTSILFVGAHLAAHQSKCDRRNQDFFDIDFGLRRKLKPLPKDVKNGVIKGGARIGASAAFDLVFWGGDFNYRGTVIEELLMLFDDNMHYDEGQRPIGNSDEEGSSIRGFQRVLIAHV